MGADEEPGGCASVETQGRRGRRHGSGCPRPGEASRAGHADHGPRPAVRPRVRKDLEALPRESGSVRRRLRPRMVQAHPPRHGPRGPLSRPGSPCRGAHLARPDPRRRSPADRREGCRRPSRRRILGSGLSVSQLVSTAWASASTFRGSDKRGGANGARIRLAPQKDWDVNQPEQLDKVLKTLEDIQSQFNGADVRRQEGLARRPDRSGRLRGRRAGGEECRSRRDGSVHAGTHGRLAGADRRAVLRRPRAVRGWLPQLPQGPRPRFRPRRCLVDKAQLLTLTAPEMTVLVGGMRVLNANVRQSPARRLHQEARDADQRLLREPARHEHRVEGGRRTPRTCSKGAIARRARSSGPARVSISSSARTPSSGRSRRSTQAADAQATFVQDFVAAWTKVMNLDRFDVA